MRDLLQLPPLRVAEDVLPGMPREPVIELLRRLREAVDRLSSSLEDDAVAALVETLGTRHEDHLRAFAERISARPGEGAATSHLLYACAAEAVEEGALGLASVGLVALLDEPATHAAALLGLAVCAVRAGRPDEALAMALSSRQGDTLHPRAYAVAGVAEHLRGRPAKARLYLALASRLARRDVEHAPDLRLAQRLLVAMQTA